MQAYKMPTHKGSKKSCVVDLFDELIVLQQNPICSWCSSRRLSFLWYTAGRKMEMYCEACQRKRRKNDEKNSFASL